MFDSQMERERCKETAERGLELFYIDVAEQCSDSTRVMDPSECSSSQ